jgi:hypothetical protein
VLNIVGTPFFVCHISEKAAGDWFVDVRKKYRSSDFDLFVEYRINEYSEFNKMYKNKEQLHKFIELIRMKCVQIDEKWEERT